MNNQQLKAFEMLKTWTARKLGIFKLVGYSGTGKTYTICKYIEWYLDEYPGNKIACIALSHKAKSNLQVNLGDHPRIDFKTITSFLGLIPQLDPHTGLAQFGKGDSIADPSDYDLVVCDEYSMVPEDYALDLNNSCNKLIYVGDDCQLAPVGEDCSVIDTIDCHSYKLTEIMRYSGELAAIADSWRITNKGTPKPVAPTSDGSIVLLSTDDFVGQFAASITNGMDVQMLAFTNKHCDQLNKLVRKKLWGVKIQPVANVGDKFIALSPMFRINPETDRHRIVLDNATRFTCIATPTLYRVFIRDRAYEYYQVPCKLESGLPFTLNIPTPTSKMLMANQILELEDSIRFTKDKSEKFRCLKLVTLLKESLDNVSHAYAVTVHKAQGSTCEAAYCDIADMQKSGDKRRLIYTAITRSKQIYI